MEIPAHQEMGHALVTAPDPRWEEETKRTIKWEMMDSHEVGWREGFGWQEKAEKARVRTQGPSKKTAKVVSLVPLEQTARERTREPFENQLKGGECRKSKRKRGGRKEVEEKEE